MKWFLVPVIGTGTFEDPYRARCADIAGLKTECKGNLGSMMLCQVSGDEDQLAKLATEPDIVDAEVMDARVSQELAKTGIDSSGITTKEALSAAIVEKQSTYIHKRTRG